MTISGVSTNVQALLADMSQLVTVIPHPPSKDVNFDGYPSAAHYYAGTQSNFATVTQNRRQIQYTIELYLVVNTETTPADEFAQAYSLIDAVVDMIDESVDLSSQILSLSPACQWVRPVPSTLERIETAEGVGLLATINLIAEDDIAFR